MKTRAYTDQSTEQDQATTTTSGNTEVGGEESNVNSVAEGGEQPKEEEKEEEGEEEEDDAACSNEAFEIMKDRLEEVLKDMDYKLKKKLAQTISGVDWSAII